MYELVPYNIIEKYIPLMELRKVSEVARSNRGFLTYYKNNPILNKEWSIRRNNFIKRHLYAALKNKEDLSIYINEPNKTTNRALALLAWAYIH
jgi:hypothetical protein